MADSNLKIGVVGGTGYTGVELLRLLAQHPNCEVAVVTSRQEAGTAVAAMFPAGPPRRRHVPSSGPGSGASRLPHRGPLPASLVEELG